MTGLPHGLAEPLHIEAPFPTWKLILAGLLLWLVYRLFTKLYRRWRARLEAAGPVSPPPPVVAFGFGDVIDEIRVRFGNDYRRGCHELAAALRRHLDAEAAGLPYPTLTAREIAGRIGDTAVSRLFALLTELQFYRREPSKSDFDGACDLAVEVVRARHGGSR